MKCYSLCFLLISLILFPASGFCAEIRVPADQPTIQAGIDAASDDDTVLVAMALTPGRAIGISTSTGKPSLSSRKTAHGTVS